VHGEDIEIAWRSREFRCVVRQVLAVATKLIANSRFTAELLVTKWKVARSRVRVLHPGVDTHYFTPIPMKRLTDGYTILCPGRLQKRKGQDVLLQAAAFLRDKIPCLRVIIAGDGPDGNAILSLINELSLSKQVIWIRNPSDDELAALYSVSDIVVLPNRTIDGDCEGFGIVLLEAQACGKPVICGNCGGTKETLLPGRSGLVIDCTQPYSLANALLTLYRRKQLLAQMGRQGRCWVTRMFDWSVLVPKAQQLLAI
jgi:phosphatidylinositol alpha-1,6-mannosyltransferase